MTASTEAIWGDPTDAAYDVTDGACIFVPTDVGDRVTYTLHDSEAAAGSTMRVCAPPATPAVVRVVAADGTVLADVGGGEHPHALAGAPRKPFGLFADFAFLTAWRLSGGG